MIGDGFGRVSLVFRRLCHESPSMKRRTPQTVGRAGKHRHHLPFAQRARFAGSRPKLRFSAAVSARAPCARAIRSNSSAVKSSGLRARIVTTFGFDFARSVREIEGDAGRVIFLEVAQGMAKDFSTS